jgi:arsenate reductase-like glutaredoxin family protein
LQKGLEVEVVDLLEEELSKEDILKLMTDKEGRMRGPVIAQDDAVIIFGFNRDKLEKLFP